MTVTASSYCSHCGAQNLGTRFCESCGQAAAATNVAVGVPAAFENASSAVNQVIHRGSPLNVVTFVSYLAYVVITSLGYLAISNFNYNFGWQAWNNVLQVFTWGSLLASGASATIAGFTSRTTSGRRAGGGILGILVFVLILLAFLPLMFGIYWLSFVAYLIPVTLFLSWAVARPFRGPGYFALLIGVALTGVTIAVSFIFGGSYLGSIAVIPLLEVATVVATVLAARSFEKNARVGPVLASSGAVGGSTGQNLGPGYPSRTNTLAVVSLVFGILSGGLVAVILGHIAKSQIRRSGEAGTGMATAGLILGYIWLTIGVVITIFYIVQLVAALNLLGGLRDY